MKTHIYQDDMLCMMFVFLNVNYLEMPQNYNLFSKNRSSG